MSRRIETRLGSGGCSQGGPGWPGATTNNIERSFRPILLVGLYWLRLWFVLGEFWKGSGGIREERRGATTNNIRRNSRQILLVGLYLLRIWFVFKSFGNALGGFCETIGCSCV